jgi:hypothetical protein
MDKATREDTFLSLEEQIQRIQFFEKNMVLLLVICVMAWVFG